MLNNPKGINKGNGSNYHSQSVKQIAKLPQNYLKIQNEPSYLKESTTQNSTLTLRDLHTNKSRQDHLNKQSLTENTSPLK